MSSNGFGTTDRLLLGVLLTFIDSPLRGRTQKFISPLCQVHGILSVTSYLFHRIQVHLLIKIGRRLKNRVVEDLEKGAARPQEMSWRMELPINFLTRRQYATSPRHASRDLNLIIPRHLSIGFSQFNICRCFLVNEIFCAFQQVQN
jgi:hypothetical protein